LRPTEPRQDPLACDDVKSSTLAQLIPSRRNTDFVGTITLDHNLASGFCESAAGRKSSVPENSAAPEGVRALSTPKLDSSPSPEVRHHIHDGILAWAWSDGRSIPANRVHADGAAGALHYACAVIEGVRVYGGRAFLARLHAERLRTSAARLGFDVPWSTDQIEAALAQVIASNAMHDGYLRPIAWPDGGGLRLASEHEAIRLAVYGLSLPSALGARARGRALLVSTWVRPGPPFAPDGVKGAAGYLVGGLALREATSLGFDDALLLDSSHSVCELTTANILVCIDGVMVTPPPGPALGGITRTALLDWARKQGRPCVERRFGLEELARASEVIACGTALEIAPITRIRTPDLDLTFPIGPMWFELAEAYLQMTVAKDR